MVFVNAKITDSMYLWLDACIIFIIVLRNKRALDTVALLLDQPP